MNHIINNANQYQLFIDHDLRHLIESALTLEQAHTQSEEYSDQRAALENELYDLYQEIGWSVVYEIKQGA